MKTALLVIAIVVAGLSCLVDRKSSDFECTTDPDCADKGGVRECKEGYCVTAACPSVCNSCGALAKTCVINCSGAECKNGIACPAGYACTFNCAQDCTPVTCTQALSCAVICNGAATCGPLQCGPATIPCTCSGSGSCQ